jgi:diguanylate cyclase (GGDEF)-like protein
VRLRVPALDDLVELGHTLDVSHIAIAKRGDVDILGSGVVEWMPMRNFEATADDVQMTAHTVLVVEDDAGIRALYREVLRMRGHLIVEVERGDEALIEARACRPDVVVLDLGLPGLDGLSVLAQLKADPDLRGVPVIVSTAWDDTATVTEALGAGAHDYVRKPFVPDELAARVEAAMRIKTERDALSLDASIDPLTHLPNRRSLTLELEREHALARRGRPVFSVLLLDVDHFKDVNDACGHQTGDRVLEEIAGRLRRRARGSDVVGRWGGEEFLIVAPDTSHDGAFSLADDLRCAVSEAPIETELGSVSVTASVGVAEWERETVEVLLSRADRALYEAKSSGRNVVVAAPRLPAIVSRVA